MTRLQQKWPDGRGTREFVNILYLHREYSQEEMSRAMETALAHGCAHLDGIQLCLTQQKQPETTFPTLDLAARPRLHGVGQQSVCPHIYDTLLGGD